MFKCVTICNMTSIRANKYMLEKKAWNMFKVKNKDILKTLVMSFGVFIVKFEQVVLAAISLIIQLLLQLL